MECGRVLVSMSKRHCWILLTIVWCVGCESGTSTPGTGSGQGSGATSGAAVTPSAVPPRPGAAAASPDAVPASASQTGVQPLVQPPSEPRAQPAVVPEAAASQIALSSGVALAQTLPDGTAVLCSMDYQWTSGGPEPGTEYVWVVKLGDGKQLTGPADVKKPRGTIQMVLRGVRPDDGPFQGAVFVKEAAPGANLTPISGFVDLR